MGNWGCATHSCVWTSGKLSSQTKRLETQKYLSPNGWVYKPISSTIVVENSPAKLFQAQAQLNNFSRLDPFTCTIIS